jgi:hypothetical protein
VRGIREFAEAEKAKQDHVADECNRFVFVNYAFIELASLLCVQVKTEDLTHNTGSPCQPSHGNLVSSVRTTAQKTANVSRPPHLESKELQP